MVETAPLKKTILDNGVRILTKRMPHIRSVSMGVWVNVGARDESADESGLSHFIEHMIFKGTNKRTGFQIAKEFDAVGGQTNAYTSMEHTCYHARVLDAHLATMADILSDIFLNSRFDEKDIQNERPVILQEIGMVEDSPDEYIHMLAGNGFWGDHPLGRSILGTRDNILGFGAETVKAFFTRCYLPSRIVVSAAGNLDHDHLVDLIGDAFRSITPGDGLPKRVTPHGRSTVTVHYRDLEQLHICAGAEGLAITDPRRFALSIMNTVLGGNMSSRLFQEIREKRGLAYAVYSFTAAHNDTGMFGIYAGVAPGKAKESIALLLDEMRKLKTERMAPSELRDAKEFLKGNLLLSSESVDNQMVRLAHNEINFEKYVPLQEVLDRIEAVTLDNIIELAQTLFRNETLMLAMLGPVSDKEPFQRLMSI